MRQLTLINLCRHQLIAEPSTAFADRQTTGRALRTLFTRFVEHRIYKRQLRRSEVPRVWRWVPVPLLARMMGRVLVLKAFKPLSAALAQ